MKSSSPHGLRRRLEALEDRLTPGTLTVTSNADSGPGSLRAAIAAAAGGDSIVFAPAVHAITLTTGELAISKSLNIQGPGPGLLAVSGNDAGRVFHTSGSVTVNI